MRAVRETEQSDGPDGERRAGVVERPSSGMQRRLDAGAGLPRVGTIVDSIEVTACVGAGLLGTLLCGRAENGPADAESMVLLAFPGAAIAEDPARVDALRLESFAAARVRHPNVVAVEGLRYWNGRPYLRAEYVRGLTLARLSRVLRTEGLQLAPFAVVGLGLRVARGLHALHRGVDPEGAALGLVHHGVAPADIVVGLDGAVKLNALSMRRVLGRVDGQDLVRARWSAPEELSGARGDGRADVHTVGLVLLELAAGRRVFDAETAEALAVLTRCKPRPTLVSMVPSASPALSAVLAAATSLDLAERPGSAAELAHLLAASMPEAQELSDAVFGRLVRAIAEGDAGELAHLRSVGVITG